MALYLKKKKLETAYFGGTTSSHVESKVQLEVVIVSFSYTFQVHCSLWGCVAGIGRGIASDQTLN